MARKSIGSSRIAVGYAEVKVTAPSHTAGVHEGNQPGMYRQMDGHLPGGMSTAARSTGINAESRNPIDPSSPNLSPA